MEFHSACLGISAPKLGLLHNCKPLVSARHVRFRNQRERLGRFEKNLCLRTLKKQVIMCSTSSSSSNGKLELPVKASPILPAARFNAEEPFHGKSGSVSFQGLTHQLVEEKKLVSAPFDVDKGSFLWILAPIALISSLILPQFFLSEIIELIFDESTIAEVVSSVISEVLFYIGLGSFLLVTDRVQRPYLEFSAKRWGLITGLRGYLTSAFFTMGLKVMVPLFACYVNFPMIGLPAVAAVLPFLMGCLAQLGFETLADRLGSSSWPIIPIVFEIYRLYQLTRAVHFLQRMLFSLKDLPATPQIAEKGGALFSMVLCFQILGLVCVWSLVTFLLRLFPSRPVAENY